MNKLLERNLPFLENRDPRLAERVRATVPPGFFQVAPSKAGPPTLTAVAPDGKSISFHSRYDPAKDGLRLAESVFEPGPSSYLVYGFGLGYHIEALLQRCPREVFVFVVEHDAACLSVAARHRDLTALLADPRLVLAIGLDRTEFFERMTRYLGSIFIGLKYLDHPPSRNFYPEEFRELRATVGDFVRYGRTVMQTNVAINRIATRNMFRNLGDYVLEPPFDTLRDMYRGRPVLVIAAGPSLAKNFELIRRYRDRVVIVAVATIYKTLLKNAIEPDFVAVVDYHEISARYFEGVSPSGRTVLVSSPRTASAVLDVFRGRKALSDAAVLDRLFPDLDLGRSDAPNVSSVAHLAFHVAEYVGGDPIVLIGQDLCYPHGVTHMPGTPIFDNWLPETGRFATMENREWEDLMRVGDYLRKVVDRRGVGVFSDETMLTYLRDFEMIFARSKAAIVDASEGGAAKSHTVAMTFSAVAEKYLTRPIGFCDPGAKFSPPPLARIEAAFADAVGKVERLHGLYERSYKLLTRIERYFYDKPRVSKLIAQLRAIGAEVEADPLNEVLKEIVQSDETIRRKKDLELATLGYTGEERQRKQFERDLPWVKGLKGGAETVLEYMRDALDKARRRFGE